MSALQSSCSMGRRDQPSWKASQESYFRFVCQTHPIPNSVRALSSKSNVSKPCTSVRFKDAGTLC